MKKLFEKILYIFYTYSITLNIFFKRLQLRMQAMQNSWSTEITRIKDEWDDVPPTFKHVIAAGTFLMVTSLFSNEIITSYYYLHYIYTSLATNLFFQDP